METDNQKLAKILIKTNQHLTGNSDKERIMNFIRFLKKEDKKRSKIINLDDYRNKQ